MKALFKLLLFLLISASSYSQYYTPVKTPLRWDKGGFDSLFLPSHDTTYQPSDKTKHWVVLKDAILYGWYETAWLPLVGHTGLVITSEDTARWNQRYRADTSFLYFNGDDFYGDGSEPNPISVNFDNFYYKYQTDSAIAANKEDAVSSVYKLAGTDSVFYALNSGDSSFAFIDSVGAGGGGSGGTWGSITGTLSSQTDLQSALNAKEPTITAGTTSQYWRGDKTWQTFPTIPAQFSPIAGTNMTITGSYPNLTFNASNSGTVTGGSIAWPGTIYTTPTTGTVSSGTLTFSPTLATQSAYALLGNNTSSTATPTFFTNPYIDGIRRNAGSLAVEARINGTWSTVFPDSTGGAPSWTLNGNSINPASNFLGTTSNNSLRIRTNNIQRMHIDSLGFVGVGMPAYGATYQMGILGHLKVNNTSTAGLFLYGGTNASGVGGTGLNMTADANGNVNMVNSGDATKIMALGNNFNLYQVLTTNSMALHGSTISGVATPARFSTILDVVSDAKGIAPPSMTQAQRDAIPKIITSVTLTSGGSGYTSNPGANASGGTLATTSSTYTQLLLTTISGGSVNSITIRNPGAYTATSATPTVTFGSAGGSGAAATLTIGYPMGMYLYCTDCAATDGSTGTLQAWNGTTWKNAW